MGFDCQSFGEHRRFVFDQISPARSLFSVPGAGNGVDLE